MNLKSLIASIGLLINSLFSPISVKANVIGDLTSNELLSPSFKIDSMLVSHYTSSSLLWANYPQTYDNLSLSYGQGSVSDPITKSFYISAMKQSGYSRTAEPLYMAKIGNSNFSNDGVLVTDLIYNTGSSYTPSPFGNAQNVSNTRFLYVDFDFAFNDLIIQKTDLFNTSVLLVKANSEAITGVVDYQFSFTLNSKTTNGDDWVITQYDYSRTGSFDMASVDYEQVSVGSSYIAPNLYRFNLFDEFESIFADEESTLWLSDFSLTLSLGTLGLWAVGWDIPYYNPSALVERNGFDIWLRDNDLLESDVLVCPDCPVCPNPTICPGQDVNINMTDWLITAIGGFFDFEIFPGFSFSGVIGIVFVLLFVLWVLKLIAGG